MFISNLEHCLTVVESSSDSEDSLAHIAVKSLDEIKKEKAVKSLVPGKFAGLNYGLTVWITCVKYHLCLT